MAVRSGEADLLGPNFGRLFRQTLNAVSAPAALSRPSSVLPRMSAVVKGFGRRPVRIVRQALGPSSESVQGRNPRGVEAENMPPLWRFDRGGAGGGSCQGAKIV